MKKIYKFYTSKIDQRTAKFDETHELSFSQKAEIEKYKRVYKLRDDPAAYDEEKEDLWGRVES